jgi:hypothetical protein
VVLGFFRAQVHRGWLLGAYHQIDRSTGPRPRSRRKPRALPALPCHVRVRWLRSWSIKHSCQHMVRNIQSIWGNCPNASNIQDIIQKDEVRFSFAKGDCFGCLRGCKALSSHLEHKHTVVRYENVRPRRKTRWKKAVVVESSWLGAFLMSSFFFGKINLDVLQIAGLPGSHIYDLLQAEIW